MCVKGAGRCRIMKTPFATSMIAATNIFCPASKSFWKCFVLFVKRGWVDQIDEAHVIKVDKSFILPDFRGKEADVVYRLKIKDSEVIFYLLIDELIGLFNRLGPTIDQLSEEQRGQFAIWLKHMLRRLTKTKKTEQELDFIITEIQRKGLSAVISNFEKNLEWIEEQAMLKGMEKGMAKGVEKGLETAAVNLLRKGMEIAFVAEVTGLPMEKIAALKKRMK
jgi:hypothetical protein